MVNFSTATCKSECQKVADFDLESLGYYGRFPRRISVRLVRRVGYFVNGVSWASYRTSEPATSIPKVQSDTVRATKG